MLEISFASISSTDRRQIRRVGACLTIQQVSGTQVNVDAGMEARDEAVESPFLHALT